MLCLASVILSFLGNLAAPGGRGQSASPESLRPGARVERELAPGQTHLYHVTLGTDEYLHLRVEQRGIDVLLALSGPGGNSVVEIDSPLGSRGYEELLWVSTHAGTYTLEIRCVETEALAGTYALDLEVRVPTDGDRVRAQAFGALARAIALVGDEGKPRDELLSHAETSLALWRRLGDRRYEAMTLTVLGASSASRGEHSQAISSYEQALELWRDVADRGATASVLVALGAEHYVLRHVAAASACYQEALELERELGDRRGEADVLTNFAMLHDVIGEKQKALEEYERALPLMEAVRSRVGQLRTLNNLGRLLDIQGESQKALARYREALRICRSLEGRPGEPVLLRSLGRLYCELGDDAEGLADLDEALRFFTAKKDERNEAVTLLYIGSARLKRGEYEKAAEVFRTALLLLRQKEDPASAVAALDQLGEATRLLGRPEEAIARFQEALPLARSVNDPFREGAILTHLGEALAAQGRTEEALTHLEESLRLRTSVRDDAGAAETRFAIARIESSRGELDKARLQMNATLDLVERLRTEVGGDELRTSFFATMQRYYAFAVDLLARSDRESPREGFDRRAFETLERERARSLLDLLAESSDLLQSGIDPSLLKRSSALRKRLTILTARRLTLRESSHASPPAKAEEIEALRAEHEAVRDAMIRGGTRYGALARRAPLGLDEAQGLLDPGDLLVEYALGDERSWVFILTARTLAVRELAPRGVIEAAARRASASLGVRDSPPGLRDDASVALSRLVLEPITDLLEPTRLAIVAEGALLSVPFAALPDPSDRAGGSPLVLRHEVVGLPSASSLTFLRAQASRSPSKTLAVLADPVFAPDDPRVIVRRADASERSANRSPSNPIDPSSMPDIGPLPRLPFSRREARSLLALVPSGQRRAAFDFDANLETATDGSLADYRIVHFATHGILNGARPELSGILLSSVTPSGETRSGFLSALDVFGLRLNADLVTVSACRSALGKEVAGEGMVGLARAFFFAGASRVLASLWSVDDAATFALMERFYRGMLGPQHLSAAAALRAAQVSLSREKRWHLPYYWGGFVLQGEPR